MGIAQSGSGISVRHSNVGFCAYFLSPIPDTAQYFRSTNNNGANSQEFLSFAPPPESLRGLESRSKQQGELGRAEACDTQTSVQHAARIRRCMPCTVTSAA